MSRVLIIYYTYYLLLNQINTISKHLLICSMEVLWMRFITSNFYTLSVFNYINVSIYILYVFCHFLYYILESAILIQNTLYHLIH